MEEGVVLGNRPTGLQLGHPGQGELLEDLRLDEQGEDGIHGRPLLIASPPSLFNELVPVQSRPLSRAGLGEVPAHISQEGEEERGEGDPCLLLGRHVLVALPEGVVRLGGHGGPPSRPAAASLATGAIPVLLLVAVLG